MDLFLQNFLTPNSMINLLRLIIRKILKDQNFESRLSSVEKDAGMYGGSEIFLRHQ